MIAWLLYWLCGFDSATWLRPLKKYPKAFLRCFFFIRIYFIFPLACLAHCIVNRNVTYLRGNTPQPMEGISKAKLASCISIYCVYYNTCYLLPPERLKDEPIWIKSSNEPRCARNPLVREVCWLDLFLQVPKGCILIRLYSRCKTWLKFSKSISCEVQCTYYI